MTASTLHKPAPDSWPNFVGDSRVNMFGAPRLHVDTNDLSFKIPSFLMVITFKDDFLRYVC